jgi:hypothetical protein
MFFWNNDLSEQLREMTKSINEITRKVDALTGNKENEDEDAPTLDTLSWAIARNGNKIDEILRLLVGFKTVESMLSEGGVLEKFDERSRKVNEMLLEFKGLIAMARGGIRNKEEKVHAAEIEPASTASTL